MLIYGDFFDKKDSKIVAKRDISAKSSAQNTSFFIVTEKQVIIFIIKKLSTTIEDK